jgi:hypothetical protein
MPSATPLPRGPSHLALFGAEDLLRDSGCPVCRYAAEAGDRFFGWFALEAHADADMITRLCQSLGLCPAHTRGLLSQPGAESRMTAVYRYLLRAAAGYLAAGTSPQAPCPACVRGSEAVLRALDTLLTGLREGQVEELRGRYRDVGGLCLPHLHAAMPRSRRRLAAWLAGEMLSRLSAGPPDLAVIAGDRDADADIRAQLRAAFPAPPESGRSGDGGICPVCLAVAQAEREVVMRAEGVGWCQVHLHDACSDMDVGTQPLSLAAQLLVRHTEHSIAWLTTRTSSAGVRSGLRGFTARRHVSRSGSVQRGCPACQATDAAAGRMLEAILGTLAAPAPALCLRHVISLRQRDLRGAEAAVRVAARRAEAILRELEDAFRKRAWAHRHEPRGREMTAWRRAAALIDGRVYGGGPAGPL